MYSVKQQIPDKFHFDQSTLGRMAIGIMFLAKQRTVVPIG